MDDIDLVSWNFTTIWHGCLLSPWIYSVVSSRHVLHLLIQVEHIQQ